jgi:hypothetical protein
MSLVRAIGLNTRPVEMVVERSRLRLFAQAIVGG